MKSVPISEFRANCFALIKRVQTTKRPVLVTRFGKPIAEIHPPSQKVYLSDRARAQRYARDIEIINRNADRLNAEAEDGLEYQAPWDVDDLKKSRPARKKSRRR